MEIKKASVAETEIAYLDEGKGETIVLLHGFCGSSRYWEEVVPALSKSYRVIVPDLPGHGETPVITKEYSIDDLADYVHKLLVSLSLDHVAMFGHSLGGYITAAFAEKYPNNLKGFSLVHSTAFPDSEEAKKGRIANVVKVQQQGIQALIDGLVPKLFAPENVIYPYVDAAKEIGLHTSPQGAINTLLAMKNRPDRNRVLEETSLPVLLVAGENDQIVPQEKTFSVTKLGITHSVIKNAGHMSMYENPKALITEIESFLSKLNNG